MAPASVFPTPSGSLSSPAPGEVELRAILAEEFARAVVAHSPSRDPGRGWGHPARNNEAKRGIRPQSHTAYSDRTVPGGGGGGPPSPNNDEGGGGRLASTWRLRSAGRPMRP